MLYVIIWPKTGLFQVFTNFGGSVLNVLSGYKTLNDCLLFKPIDNCNSLAVEEFINHPYCY